MVNGIRGMAVVLSMLGLASCSQTSQAPAAPAASADAASYKVEVVAAGLDVPWSLAFLPDGTALVTERGGTLRVLENGALRPEPVTGVPAVFNEGQAGLFEARPSPNFAEDHQVYLTYAEGTAQANRTTLARATFDGHALTNLQVLWQVSPAKEGGAHFGGRMLFLPDNTLLLTLGDGFAYRERAQDLSSDLGKVVRLTLDGAPAPGNPLATQPGARLEIYSYGHRNVQGIAYDPASGRIWTCEHGPRGGDEVNLMRAGANYGWPVITYGVDYSGAIISPFTEREGMEQPLTYWVPSIAPSGMTFYNGDLFPAWKGDLFVSALAGAQLRRVDLDANGAVLHEEVLLAELEGRFRYVTQGPDGALYVLAEATGENPEGQILRLVPGA
jgi:glucose/arabinose dehydrogenase